MGAMKGERVLHRQSVTAVAGALVHMLPAARVQMAPLPTGNFFFDLWPMREVPAQGLWAAPHYDSLPAPLFRLDQATVYGSAGILALGDKVLEESLINTWPRQHHYRHLPRAIAIQQRPPIMLKGLYVSLLAPGEFDYRHIVLSSLARLGAVPHGALVNATGVLVPRGGAIMRELIALLDLLPTLRIHEVGPEDTLRVEQLLYPLPVAGEAPCHPCVSSFFSAVSANVPKSGRPLPRLVYLDQRVSDFRPLRNEQALVEAVADRGFTAIKLHTLCLEDQIRLFRNAEAIVAPHGPHLANLGFARPGCVVIELLMDACVDWSFRNLAALGGLRYDCVIGRASRPWPDLDALFNQTMWDVSVPHTIAAIAHALAGQHGDVRAA